jgi:hypothetical protein
VNASQIKEMKELVIFSKKLSEWHVKNLQNFIMVALDNVKTAEIRYDLGLELKGEGGYIDYTVTPKTRARLAKNKAELEQRCKHLEKWVHHILWKELKVQVIDKRSGETLYPRSK